MKKWLPKLYKKGIEKLEKRWNEYNVCRVLSWRKTYKSEKFILLFFELLF